MRQCSAKPRKIRATICLLVKLNWFYMAEGNKTFTVKYLEDFVHEHIQQKINNNELPLVGFDMVNAENFKREFEIYENTLLEGIVNGIAMCGGKIDGIEGI